ncbi:DUF3022 domain-containing protein [Burkholderia gladioli pv. alliicola]|uniref:DUF3022 domain-containing protein n=1 Tax=Burkholderia gladioli TaxID=28095 RepID=UPI001C23DD7E|nr:DUF3022 domain-containing protein [Burkholderia gladioli]MBU9214615.1 DUF3022 domain-containing protein [Burkholderia gladioli]MDN7722814.1 DUF3022 domain-containing protein [Burkholderia gladioli]
MDDYHYDCASAEFDALAHVICDLFPEQTSFAERGDEGGRFLYVQWLGMRFGSAPKRMTLALRIESAAFARYLAMRPMQRARSHAVLRAYVEAFLGSLEERHAQGQAIERDTELVLGEEFA